ncbi:hypothetical protein ACLOJK_037938 [Asimina triloba]
MAKRSSSCGWKGKSARTPLSEISGNNNVRVRASSKCRNPRKKKISPHADAEDKSLDLLLMAHSQLSNALDQNSFKPKSQCNGYVVRSERLKISVVQFQHRRVLVAMVGDDKGYAVRSEQIKRSVDQFQHRRQLVATVGNDKIEPPKVGVNVTVLSELKTMLENARKVDFGG